LDHLAIEPSRSYSERSLQWHSWYIGAPALAAAIVGTALLVRKIVKGNGGREGLIVASFLSVGLVYLWDPSIFPDQIWVMRRYLPLVLPGFILLAAVAVDMLWRQRNVHWISIAARAVGGLLVLALLAWPVHTDWRVRGETTERGFLRSVEQMCLTFGPKASVVVIAAGPRDRAVPQTVRSFCNSPVAIFDPAATRAPAADDRRAFAKLAGAWREQGRTLFVISNSAPAVARVLPGGQEMTVVVAQNSLFLQERLAGRPDGFRSEAYNFTIARVP
jgi:hypothetical protein